MVRFISLLGSLAVVGLLAGTADLCAQDKLKAPAGAVAPQPASPISWSLHPGLILHAQSYHGGLPLPVVGVRLNWVPLPDSPGPVLLLHSEVSVALALEESTCINAPDAGTGGCAMVSGAAALPLPALYVGFRVLSRPTGARLIFGADYGLHPDGRVLAPALGFGFDHESGLGGSLELRLGSFESQRWSKELVLGFHW